MPPKAKKRTAEEEEKFRLEEEIPSQCQLQRPRKDHVNNASRKYEAYYYPR